MRHLRIAAIHGETICDECGHPASEHAEGYICTHKLDDPDDGWYGVCPCVRREDLLEPETDT